MIKRIQELKNIYNNSYFVLLGKYEVLFIEVEYV